MRLAKTSVFFIISANLWGFCYLFWNIYFLVTENDNWVILARKNHGQGTSAYRQRHSCTNSHDWKKGGKMRNEGQRKGKSHVAFMLWRCVKLPLKMNTTWHWHMTASLNPHPDHIHQEIIMVQVGLVSEQFFFFFMICHKIQFFPIFHFLM